MKIPTGDNLKAVVSLLKSVMKQSYGVASRYELASFFGMKNFTSAVKEELRRVASDAGYLGASAGSIDFYDAKEGKILIANTDRRIE